MKLPYCPSLILPHLLLPLLFFSFKTFNSIIIISLSLPIYKFLFLLTTHKICYCYKQSCLFQANAERWTRWNYEISILNQFISLIFMILFNLVIWYNFLIKFLCFSIGFSFMFDGFGCLILWNRMMRDYKVEMINDGMQEFYVEFRGPSESNILYWLFSLISFYLSLVG